MSAYSVCRRSLKSVQLIGLYGNLLHSVGRTINDGARRTFLSAAYACDKAWEKRINEPLIMQIDPPTYYIELERKFNAQKRISAIDLDLFAHSLTNDDMLDELEDIVRQFRNTPDTIRMLPSTPHAVVKLFLQYGQYEVLMKILADKSNFGIFPSHYCFNLLMDTFLKRQNNRDAARVAAEVMLQEDFSHPITKILALYSCLAYLKSPLPEPWVYQAPPPEIEPEETVVIRLGYLPPNYFDDHFDLTDPTNLLGKTLLKVGQQFPDQLGRTCQMMGLAMYEKWEDLHKYLETISRDKKDQLVYKEGIDRVRTQLQAIPDDEKKTREEWDAKLNPLLNSLEKRSSDNSPLDVARELVSAAVTEHEAADIAAQLKLHDQWAVARSNEVERQLKEFSRNARIKKLQEIRDDLQRREQLLFFFENFEKHAMQVQIYDKVANEVAQKLAKDDDASYVPPEVRKRWQSPRE